MDEESQVTIHEEYRPRALLFRSIGLTALVVIAGTRTSWSNNRMEVTPSTSLQVEQELPADPSKLSLQARLDQWDQYKSKLGDWMHATKQDSEQLGLTLREDTSALWNATSFHVRDSWNSTAVEQVDLWNEAVQGAKHGLATGGAWTQHLWNETSNGVKYAEEATEKKSGAVWNATVHGVEHAGESTVEEVTDLWNKTTQWSGRSQEATKETVGNMKESALDEAKEILNKTVQLSGHVGEATEEKATSLWNASVHGVGNLEESGFLEAAKLWNETAQMLGHVENAAVEKSEALWNTTKVFAENTKKSSMEKADEFWNNTAHDAENAGSVVEGWFFQAEDGTKHLWNETSHTTGDVMRKGGQSIEEWWNHTSYKTKTWWQDRLVWWQNLTDSGKQAEDAPTMVYLNNSYAYSLLTNGMGKWFDYTQDYFSYQKGWDAQINQAYCAVATSAALLNSFRDEEGMVLPQDPVYDPHPYATQSSLFDECTESHVIFQNSSYNGVLVSPGGLGMAQTKALLECWIPETWTVTAHHVDPLKVTIDTVRHDIRQALQNPRARIVINYDRSAVGQLGGGHWSPLGSYSSDRDAVLVMDVAKYKYPAVWIPLTALYNSLSTYDTCGEWEFPLAQLGLRNKYQEPTNELDYRVSMTKLGCKATRRGYIIVQKE